MSKTYNYLMRAGIITLIWACAGGVTAAFGAPSSEPVPPREKRVFYFPQNGSVLMKGYKQNDSELKRLQQLLSSENLPHIERIIIVGGTSPEGGEAYNAKLAKARAVETRGVINWKLPKALEMFNIPIELRTVSADNLVDSLRHIVASRSDVPCRSTLLEILDSDGSVSEKMARILLECKKDAYSYMLSNFFGEFRSATVYVIYKGDAGYGFPWSPVADEMNVADAAVTGITGVPQSLADSLTNISASAQGIEEAVSTTPQSVATDSSHVAVSSATADITSAISQRPDTKRVAIAIKTNLLFDLVTAANLELEIPIGPRWSIAAGVVSPQWHFNNRHSMMITEISLEPRLWLGDREHLKSGAKRNSLTGHFIGVYGNWIESYDLQFKQNGVMGTGYGAGITYGFAHRLGRSFNMEYSIGVGAVYLKNKSFAVTDDYSYKVLKKESEGWKFLPTRAKISLVWLIGNKKANHK